MFQNLSTPQSPSLKCHCLLGSHKRISLPTPQSLCAFGAYICLSWMVPIPLSSTWKQPITLEVLHRAACRVITGCLFSTPPHYSATNHLEVLHRAACRVITGCLFSTPSSLLLFEAQLPPLKLTLEHQTLYSFERALRLPPTSPAFMLWQLETFPVDYRRNPPVDHSVLQPHNHSHPHANL